MKKNETLFLVLFAIVSVAVFAIAVVVKDRVEGIRGRGSSAEAEGSLVESADGISVLPSSNDDKIVADAAAGFSFSVPENWYVEKNADTGITVYPDYDPKNGRAPECKIEISTLEASSSLADGTRLGTDVDTDNLNAWITQYLHADPTADVTEVSRTPIAIGGASGSAIEWSGVLNGVTTTLMYAVMPGGDILEVAPSTLSSSSDSSDASGDCDVNSQAIIENLIFSDHER